MDLTSLITGGAAIVSGGITGVVGAALSRIFDVWKQKQQLDILKEQNRHAETMKERDAAIMREEWAQRTRIAEVEAGAKVDVSANEAFAKSFETEPKRYSEGMKPPSNSTLGRIVSGAGWFIMVLLDAVRGGIRPGLAIYLAYIVTQMYDTQRAVLAVLGADQTAAMTLVYGRIVDTMLYLFTTCVLWYYGVRNTQAAPRTR